ncbi:MAG: right-handed parallel beta-helix repeat-containing protein [Bdellovibrionaceae bacterium]|nr:right-handed parallel beta-helix repeat-containing protein [Pseudobdellovibrionaceae bacterium]
MLTSTKGKVLYALISCCLIIGFSNCSSSSGPSAPGVVDDVTQKSGYFVDATNGNDSNAGNSAAAPWKSLAKVSGATFNSGTTIYLKKDEVWREQLNIPSSGVTIDAYGSGGALPLIDGSIEVKDWVAEGGGIYSQQVNLDANEALGNVSENGVILNFLPWKSTSDATFASAIFGTFSFEYSQKKLFIKVSANPTGKSYLASRKLYGVSAIGKSDILIQNIKITRFSLNGVNFQNCQNCSVKNATISDGGGVVLASNPSGTPSYIYGGNGIEYDTNSSGGIVDGVAISGIFDSGISPQTYANNETSSGITFQNSTIDTSGFAGVEISILSNGGKTGSQIKDVRMTGLTITNSGKGWSGRRYGTEGHGVRIQADAGAGTMSGIVLQASTIDGSAGVGVKLVGEVGAVTLSRLKVSNNNVGIEALDPVGQSLRLDLSTSLIFNNTGGGIVFNAPKAGGLSVQQNTLTNNPPINFSVYNQAGRAKIQNNIFYSSATLTHVYVASPLTGEVAFNNNCYNEMVNMIGYGGAAHSTVLSFRGATGFENQGLGGQVNFVNPATADFRLQAGSQCRGLGDPSIGISLDYSGVSFSSPPPSGAME